MINFLDGPAKGTVLELRRAPLLLRVVIDRTTGEVDALDQLEDVPRLGEAVHVYHRQGAPRRFHVRYSGRRDGRRSGCVLAADYALFPFQPADEVARDNERWQKWAAMVAETWESKEKET